MATDFGKPSVVLGFGEVAGATALHLAGPLAERSSLFRVGLDNEVPSENLSKFDDSSFLWVESGKAWLPTNEWLQRLPWAAWMIDTHMRLRWRLALGGAFDHVFCAQRDAVGAFAQRGISSSWLPLAVPRELCGPGLPLAERPYDIAFVGNVPRNGRRERLLRVLANKYRLLNPTDGFVTPARMMSIYRSAQIVVNIPLQRDLNMRTFEAAGARAALITGPQEGLDVILPSGSYTQVQTDDPDDWMVAVERILSGGEGQIGANRAYEAVLGLHTYDHRAAEIITRLSSLEGRRVSSRERSEGIAAGLSHYSMCEDLLRFPGLSRSRLVQRYSQALAWKVGRVGIELARERLHLLPMDR